MAGPPTATAPIISPMIGYLEELVLGSLRHVEDFAWPWTPASPLPTLSFERLRMLSVVFSTCSSRNDDFRALERFLNLTASTLQHLEILEDRGSPDMRLPQPLPSLGELVNLRSITVTTGSNEISVAWVRTILESIPVDNQISSFTLHLHLIRTDPAWIQRWRRWTIGRTPQWEPLDVLLTRDRHSVHLTSVTLHFTYCDHPEMFKAFIEQQLPRLIEKGILKIGTFPRSQPKASRGSL
ncbi:hypothetical protein DXG03_003813, partial [Asterophora parasitica]